MGNHHYNTPNFDHLNKAIIIGIVLNFLYVIIQITIGIRINSLSLLSDAGHNFLDVGSLALVLFAFKLNNATATPKFTYGYKKASIIISLLNAIILLVSIGAIGYESFLRFSNPHPLPGKVISTIAAVGIIINSFTAYLFYRDRNNELNAKSAFLHLFSDALVSLGLVLGGFLIHYTQIYWIDPLLSLIICIVIIASTWHLLSDSLKLSLDGVPDYIDVTVIKQNTKMLEGVLDIHHIHIWALSTTENAMTAHIVINDSLSNTQVMDIKKAIRNLLANYNIHHITIEIETIEYHCENINC